MIEVHKCSCRCGRCVPMREGRCQFRGVRLTPNELNCIHTQEGLCPDCRADYEYDPESWLEYGDHPEGLRRWEELQKEIAAVAEPVQSMDADPDIPF